MSPVEDPHCIVIGTIVVSHTVGGKSREFIWNIGLVHLWIREGACPRNANPDCARGLVKPYGFLCDFVVAMWHLGRDSTIVTATHGPIKFRGCAPKANKSQYHLLFPQVLYVRTGLVPCGCRNCMMTINKNVESPTPCSLGVPSTCTP